MRLLRALSAAVLLGAGLLTVPMASPNPAAAVGPVPDCEIADHLTVPRGYDDWATTLVDWSLGVGKDYKPPDLVNVRTGGVSGGGLIRKVVIEDLKALAAAAKKNGTPLVAWSPYRTYATQEKLFDGGVRAYGYDSAITFWGRPGHSEHQLGVTIDFVAVGDKGLTSNWEVTRTGAWMAKHAWEYGWLMSYPKGKQSVVCYHYEPWHYRYYGRELAKKIHDSGLTPREYLWINFTQLDSSFQPLPSPTPVPSPTPSPSPEITPPPSAIGSAPVATDPAPTTPPTSPAGLWFGVDPAVVIAGVLIVLAVIGLAISLQRARRPRGRSACGS